MWAPFVSLLLALNLLLERRRSGQREREREGWKGGNGEEAAQTPHPFVLYKKRQQLKKETTRYRTQGDG